MTELQLYKFIQDNGVEMHWHGDELMCFLDAWMINDFCYMASHDLFDDEGIECRLKNSYIAFDLCDVCEYYEIDPENIFSKEEE
jgi:hypothetical protein